MGDGCATSICDRILLLVLVRSCLVTPPDRRATECSTGATPNALHREILCSLCRLQLLLSLPDALPRRCRCRR
jgi:hypothetical protein